MVVINMRSGFKLSEFHDAAASFGQPIPPKGLRGRAVPADPAEGCNSIDPAPVDTEHNLPMFAVIGEGNENLVDSPEVGIRIHDS